MNSCFLKHINISIINSDDKDTVFTTTYIDENVKQENKGNDYKSSFLNLKGFSLSYYYYYYYIKVLIYIYIHIVSGFGTNIGTKLPLFFRNYCKTILTGDLHE